MKRMAAIILCLALVFALTACASEGKQKEQGYADVYRAIKACRSENGARMTMYNTVTDDMAYGETAQDYSKTNTQVDGIDEGDKIKTDGKYIYYVCGNSIDIYEAAGAGSRRVGCIKSDDENEGTTCAIYLHDGVLIVVMCRFGFCVYSDAADLEGDRDRERTTVYYYDVSDPAAPKLISSAGQDGSLMTSRLYDGKLSQSATHSDTGSASSYTYRLPLRKKQASKRSLYPRRQPQRGVIAHRACTRRDC